MVETLVTRASGAPSIKQATMASPDRVQHTITQIWVCFLSCIEASILSDFKSEIANALDDMKNENDMLKQKVESVEHSSSLLAAGQNAQIAVLAQMRDEANRIAVEKGEAQTREAVAAEAMARIKRQLGKALDDNRAAETELQDLAIMPTRLLDMARRVGDATVTTVELEESVVSLRASKEEAIKRRDVEKERGDALSHELATLQNEKSKLEKHCTTIESEIGKLKLEKESMDIKIQFLENQVQEHGQDKDKNSELTQELSKRANAQKFMNAALRSQLNEMKFKLQHEEMRAQASEHQAGAEKMVNESLRGDLRSVHSRLAKAISDGEQRETEQRERADLAEMKVTYLEEEIQYLKSTYENSEDQLVGSYSARMQEYEDTIEDLKEKLGQARKHLEDMTVELQETKHAAEAASEREAAHHCTEVGVLKTIIYQLECNMAEGSDKATKAIYEIARIAQGQLGEQKKKVEKLNRDVLERDTQAEALKKQIRMDAKRVKEAEAAEKRFREEIRVLQKVVDEASSREEALKEQMRELQEELMQAQAEGMESKATIERLEDELEDLRSLYEDAKEEIERLKQEFAEREQELLEAQRGAQEAAEMAMAQIEEMFKSNEQALAEAEAKIKEAEEAEARAKAEAEETAARAEADAREAAARAEAELRDATARAEADAMAKMQAGATTGPEVVKEVMQAVAAASAVSCCARQAASRRCRGRR